MDLGNPAALLSAAVVNYQNGQFALIEINKFKPVANSALEP